MKLPFGLTIIREKRNAADRFGTLMAAHAGVPLVALGGFSPENLSMVYAAVQAIAAGLASLPVWVYRVTPEGREIDLNHPLMRLVRGGVNDHQTWPDFIEWLAAEILLQGNGLAYIETDGSAGLRALQPCPWRNSSAILMGTGRLRYDVTEMAGIYGAGGRMRRFGQDDALHVRDRSDDGMIGRSRLSRAARAVSAAMATEEHAERSFRNGMFPSGALSTDHNLGADGAKQLRAALESSFAGPTNAGKFIILQHGMKYTPITVSPEDAELLESRRFSGEEIARLFQVPPAIVGDLSHGTFTNSETAGRWFAQHTLRPWARKLQAAMTRSLFTEAERQTHEIEFDLSDLLRGDPESRWKSHQIAVQSKILTPNEVREIEGFNPRPDGDRLQEAQPATPGQVPAEEEETK